ncbi:sigma-54-dependent transcriptional regulator [Crateriforma conspicua]|uniref:Transcriptional regulatory protein QseF n=2 Tax=Crateriforma conspicua TaxID=2527996 RepID=A0A5C5Y954_9PLAN|nr:sigma-54 dependent transcriptional regulator [Crateriforma conspicua]QDV61546.1 Transcriptional regulatory protein QseF [Crateriforma conspicua]TWT72207.1 Transcriptional regulatory protein QseF [Crateriforma conspicua]
MPGPSPCVIGTMDNRLMKLLLVDHDDDFRQGCARWMQHKGHRVTQATCGVEALQLCERHGYDVVVIDIDMPGVTGLEFLQRVRQDDLDLEVVILTGQGSISSAVAAMQMGACDYLTKPCALGELEHHCHVAHDRAVLRRENQNLKAVMSRQRPAARLVGHSAPIASVKRMIEKVAPTDKPVLIEGESGTGKEVVARLIQKHSHVAERPFVTINCAALPEQLVESELFGHLKGSFTGATADKPGLFEIADGGTLFIDEIGELPPSLQPKLLRVLEDGSMRRIGCHKERVVNVRVIAATNRDLEDEVEQGRFRRDLYYRINVLSLRLPPLRDRVGDIDVLIDHLLPDDWHVDVLARQAMNAYHWPGNIRQLINVLERAMILANGQEITLDDLTHDVADCTGDAECQVVTATPRSILDQAGMQEGRTPLTIDELTKTHVLDVLSACNGNKAKTARMLGIHRRKLYRLLHRYEGDAVPATDDVVQ